MNEILRRRRALMGQQASTPILPTGYQQVEWIENPGTDEYLVTGLTQADVAEIVIDMEKVSSGGAGVIVCCIINGTTLTFPAANIANLNLTGAHLGYSCSPTIGVSDYPPRGYVTLTKVTNSNYPIVMFAWNNNSYKGKIKVFGIVFKNTSNNVIATAIPCYRVADNVIGMYDITRNVFMETTGTWTKGADI